MRKNNNENKRLVLGQSKLFFVMLSLSILAALILLSFFFSGYARGVLIEVSERLKGSPLETKTIDQKLGSFITLLVIIVLSLPLYFMRFHENGSIEQLSTERKTCDASIRRDDTFPTLSSYLKDFLAFMRGNKVLSMLAFSLTLLVYFPLLAGQVLGLDAEIYITETREAQNFFLSIGRLGLVFLERFLNPLGFNPTFARFMSIIFMSFAALSHAHFFTHIYQSSSKNQNNKLSLFLSLAFFISSEIFVEQLSFTSQSLEVSLTLIFIPAAAFFFFESIRLKKLLPLVLSFLSFVFFISVYQASFIMFSLETLICFLAHIETNSFASTDEASNKLGTEKPLWALAVKLFLMLLLGILTYLVLNSLFLYSLKIEKISYLGGMMRGRSVREIALSPFRFLFTFTQENASLLIALLFLSPIYLRLSLTRKVKRPIIYTLAILALPLSVFIYPLLGDAPLRSRWELPLVTSFMVMRIFLNQSGKIKNAFLTFFLILAVILTEKCALLTFTDYERWECDVATARDIGERIVSLNSETRKVFFYGAYRSEKHFPHLKADILGRSMFSKNDNKVITDATKRGTCLLNYLGYTFIPVREDEDVLINLARSLANSMKDYPQNGSIIDAGSVIVVRFGPSTYKEQKGK